MACSLLGFDTKAVAAEEATATFEETELALEVTPGPPAEIVPEGPGVMDAGIASELDVALGASSWDDEELLIDPGVNEAPDVEPETGEPEMEESTEALDMAPLEKLNLAFDEELVDVCVDVGLDTSCWDDEELLIDPHVDEAPTVGLETGEPDMKDDLEVLDMVLLE